jgi:hypothetical protein
MPFASLTRHVELCGRLARAAWWATLYFLVGTAAAVEITVSGQATGLTPTLIGYNSGHFMPGSNTADWWRYAGVNAARIFTSPSVVEGDDDNGVWGDGVRTEGLFLERRAAVRADPLNTELINWPHFQQGYQGTTGSGNRMSFEHAYRSLHDLGVAPLAVITRSSGSTPWSASGTVLGWKDRWEHWQHYYAQAFYLARNFDVERFQMYNEPDHSSQSISQAEYLERLQFASDAVQAALADVNALFGKSLVPQLQAPVSAGGSSKFLPRPGGDSRDDVTGWGEWVVENRHTNFLGEVDPQFNLVHTYAYQQYNKTGPDFGGELALIKELVNATSGGEAMKFAVTEFNVHTAAVFGGLEATLDAPEKSARLGSILANLALNQPDELYVFKFSQTDNFGDGVVKKNGVHYVDNATAPYNVGGITKGGEVVRLFTKGFAGARDLLASPQVSASGSGDLQIAASFDRQQATYALFVANESTVARSLQIDLRQWELDPGVPLTIEEVSAAKHGEIRSRVVVGPSGIVNLQQPAESVWLLSASQKLPTYQVTLVPTDDAMVKAGVNSGTNYGSSSNLWVKNEPTNANARNVSLIKFHLGDTATAGIQQAVLRVQGENTGSEDYALTHVYAILDDQWDEATVTWDTAPNLGASVGIVDSIDHNFLEQVGETAWFAGHLTAGPTLGELMLDVTAVVKDHPDQQISFLIAREVRQNGENVDDALTALQLASRERGSTPGPELLLSLGPLALPGDHDGDGVVDAADLSLWESHLGGEWSGASGTGLLAWQRGVGSQLPTGAQNSGPHLSGVVAEPLSIGLAGLPFAACYGFLWGRPVRRTLRVKAGWRRSRTRRSARPYQRAPSSRHFPK